MANPAPSSRPYWDLSGLSLHWSLDLEQAGPTTVGSCVQLPCCVYISACLLFHFWSLKLKRTRFPQKRRKSSTLCVSKAHCARWLFLVLLGQQMGMSSGMSMGFSMRWGRRLSWLLTTEVERNDSEFLAEFQEGLRRALPTGSVLKPLKPQFF